jgi:hypothetical protein
MTTDHSSEYVCSGSSPGETMSGDDEPGMRSVRRTPSPEYLHFLAEALEQAFNEPTAPFVAVPR